MLKHITTGQPSSTGSRLHHNDYQESSVIPSTGILRLHHHILHEDQHHTNSRNGRHGSDVYDSVMHPTTQLPMGTQLHGRPRVTTPSSGNQHPLNQSQLSMNNVCQKLHNNHHSHVLNLSTLSNSKRSVNSVSPIVGGSNNNGGRAVHTLVQHLNQERTKINGGLDISKSSKTPYQPTPSPEPHQFQPIMQVPTGSNIAPLNNSWTTTMSSSKVQETGAKEMLTSLGLLCLISSFLALLSLIFLLKISPINAVASTLIGPEDYAIVYQVTLALCALALSLNLCCLLVCAIQFLFAVELVKSPSKGHRTNKYLQKSSVSRVCAVGGFFISIPVFLTGMILYTFTQFHTTSAIVTAIFIALGIVFCGCAMVHNVFVWQKEKTNEVEAMAREQCKTVAHSRRYQQELQQNHHEQHSRGSHSQQHPSNLHHHLRHVSMSPPLLLSSPSSLATTHNHLHMSSHRNIPTTPPTSPGDRSPTNTVNKLYKSQQHLSREITGSVSPGIPTATLDLSSAANTNSPHELSTLV